MRIVRRKEFLSLPAGTPYLQANGHFCWSDLRIKQETSLTEGVGDWYEHGVNEIEATGSDQEFKRWFEMLEEGASYPLDLESVGRDGRFDDDAIFMVYEAEDIAKLRDLFTRLAG